MSGEPMAIAFRGFLSEADAGDPLAVSTVGFLTGAAVAPPFEGVEIAESRVTVAIIAESTVEC